MAYSGRAANKLSSATNRRVVVVLPTLLSAQLRRRDAVITVLLALEVTICDKPSNAALTHVVEELDVVIPQRVRSLRLSRVVPAPGRHLLDKWDGGRGGLTVRCWWQ